ncbi:hypothetical protein F4X90_08525, partial [Candidatus Poribacteria bacterium]|nr:hypothetical protein [Candidatus Poribacteria bacterium]
MTSLQIPYAFTDDKLPVSPQGGEKGQDFSCPICDSEVILKRGDIRVPHFAHKPDTKCSGEGVRHKVAKQMIYLMHLRTVRTIMMSVTTFRRCPNCSQGRLFSQTPQYDDVACEVDVGRHRVDIALLRDGKPVSGIEVRDTHPVDDPKWDAFKELGFPCIEVEAKDVIYMWEYDLKSWRKPIPKLSLPMRLDLKAIRHNLFHFNDRLRRIYCDECDAGVDHQEKDEYITEEDASIPEEVRAEILNEVDRHVPR